VYATLTAPKNGIDLLPLREWAAVWLTGVYKQSYGPTPFLVPMISPLALVTPDQALILWLLINLAASAVVLFLAVKVFGESWTLPNKVLLCAMFLSWAPFRVTLRVGQVSILITLCALSALLAMKRNKRVLGGLCLGLSLCKFSMTLPFLLYFVWKREWKVVSSAILTVAVLTIVFAVGANVSPITVTHDYISAIGQKSPSNDAAFSGSTEIGPLIFSLTGNNEPVANAITVIVEVAGLLAMFLCFRRARHYPEAHYAALASYSLWFVYHRTYDSVLFILPAAVLVGLIQNERFKRLGIVWLSALGLLVLSIPGLLTERLHLNPAVLAQSPLGLLGLHIERLLGLGLFCALLAVLLKAGETPGEREAPCLTH